MMLTIALAIGVVVTLAAVTGGFLHFDMFGTGEYVPFFEARVSAIKYR